MNTILWDIKKRKLQQLMLSFSFNLRSFFATNLLRKCAHTDLEGESVKRYVGCMSQLNLHLLRPPGEMLLQSTETIQLDLRNNSLELT